MQNAQKALLDFFKKNRYTRPFLSIAGIFTVVWPGFVLLFSHFGIVWNIFQHFSASLFIVFAACAILSFAKNDMLMLGIGFGCLALNEFIKMIIGFVWMLEPWVGIFNQPYFNINGFLMLSFYSLLTVGCIIRFIKTMQAKSAANPRPAAPAQAAPAAAQVVCPQCGKVCSAETKFCNGCGNQLRP